MTPKLLDVIKDAGLTHEEVIKLISQIADKPDTEIEESEVEAPEEGEDDKPEDEIELRIIDMKDEDKEEPDKEEDRIETIELTQEELDKKIEDAITDKLKSTRKIPSKGKIVAKPQSNVEVIKKNWFEQIV